MKSLLALLFACSLATAEEGFATGIDRRDNRVADIGTVACIEPDQALIHCRTRNSGGTL